MNRLEKLKKIATRKLLSMLRSMYGSYELSEEELEVYGEYTSEELRNELATREHIPNKIEGEEIRRERAKTKRDARNNKFIR